MLVTGKHQYTTQPGEVEENSSTSARFTRLRITTRRRHPGHEPGKTDFARDQAALVGASPLGQLAARGFHRDIFT